MSKQEAQQITERLASYQKEVTADREAALAALQRAGLITKNGRPTEFYAASKTNGTQQPRTRRAPH